MEKGSGFGKRWVEDEKDVSSRSRGIFVFESKTGFREMLRLPKLRCYMTHL